MLKGVQTEHLILPVAGMARIDWGRTMRYGLGSAGSPRILTSRHAYGVKWQMCISMWAGSQLGVHLDAGPLACSLIHVLCVLSSHDVVEDRYKDCPRAHLQCKA